MPTAEVRVRPVEPRDDRAALAVVRARNLVDVGEPDYTLDDLHAEWARDDLTAWVAEVEGEVVGVGLVDSMGGYVGVHPEHEGRGIGTALRRIVEQGERDAGLKRHVQGVSERNPSGQEHLRAAGYRVGWHLWRMQVALDRDFPASGGVRTYDPERDDPHAVHALIQEAFLEIEHHTPETFEDWKRWVLDRADLYLRHYLVAEADGEVVGALIGTAAEGAGFIHELAVRSRARGRGLAKALLHESFRRFRADGCESASLWVVGSNEGALRLYESVGMQRRLTLDKWERAFD